MSKNSFLLGIISFSLVLGLSTACSTENAKQQQKVESQSSSQQQGEVPLESAVGYNYTRLRELLANQEWKEADEETAQAMLKVAGREEEGYFTIENIDNFPCEDLRIIDRLWVKYSNGKLGLSVQKEIYQERGGIWKKFGDTVGWREQGGWKSYEELNWKSPTAPNAPQGHLPVSWREATRGGWFFSRAETCKL